MEDNNRNLNFEKLTKLDHFLEKDSLNSLVVCVVLVVAITQLAKSLFPQISPQVIVLIFSAFFSYCRMILNNHLTRENIFERFIVATINIVPIAFGAIGSYDLIVENILKKAVIPS